MESEFLRGVLAIALAAFVGGFVHWCLTAPANPRSRIAKTMSYPTNAGTYPPERRRS